MKLSITPSRKEWITGAIWLALQATVVPVVLAVIFLLLPIGLSNAMMNVVVFVINFLVTLIIFRKFLLASARHFFSKTLWHLGLVALGLVAYFVISFVYSILLQNLGLVTDNVNDGTIAQMLQEDFLPLAVSMVLLVPFSEELLYRGTLFAPLYNRSKLAAYGLSVVLFSLAHVVGYIGTYDLMTLAQCFLQYIPASLCLAWIYAASDNIFVPMLVHAVVNSFGLLILR